MILFIDTTSPAEAMIKLDDTTLITKSLDANGKQQILTQIAHLIKKQKKDLKEISKIVVNPGPGSFTGVRVGVSIANALGMSLNMPVVSVYNQDENREYPIAPVYDRPPNITS